jgi:ADP-heptose:LPS heptosyltransferase
MSLLQNKESLSILVYKSYGGLGDIFFTLPSLYLLKQQFSTVTFATQSRLVALFQKNLKDIKVVDENEVNPDAFDTVIELGNYPRFHNDAEKVPQITYHTHKKVKQHAINHYVDGVIARFPGLKKNEAPFPYFDKTKSHELYYTVHAGAGFILKAWPVSHYAQLIEMIHLKYPELKVKLIMGPNDPNPVPYFKQKNIAYELVTGGIDEVADAISGAQFHIGNDAGITHLAGAFNIPILTIYGPTGPGSWGAFSEKVELIWGKKGNCNIRCKYEVIINCPSRVCLSKVKPELMMFYLYKLLNKMVDSDSTKYAFNPAFTIQKEADHLIFKNQENEYLIEFSDDDSRKFMMDETTATLLDVSKMPIQFQEIFDALVQLQIFQKVPNIESLQN